VKLAADVWRALSALATQAGRARADQRAQRQELREMAARAQRDGATHGKRYGPAVAFYRPHAGSVERCFAEYNPSTRRYEWIREPPDWQTDPAGIPDGATPVSEIARRGI
jgi:hypothetical protein